jgi:hypothetical protein
MLKLVRIVLVATSPEQSGNERVFLDLILNPDNTANPKFPTYGFSGDGFPRPTPQPTVKPFILYADGKMDFGEDATTPDDNYGDRFDTCDVYSRQRIVTVGGYICIGEEHDYQISNVTELGAVS